MQAFLVFYFVCIPSFCFSLGMEFAYCVLGSGSSGNCTYVRCGETELLIDAGFSRKELIKRLAEIKVNPENIDAILLSHEHSDHTTGIPMWFKKFNTPLFANKATVDALGHKKNYLNLPWKIFTNGSSFTLKGLTVEPFSVPHDAYDPVGFILRFGENSLGVVTDIGTTTHLIIERLKSCNHLIFEANYCPELLRAAPRPPYLKQRIMGRQGHLSNEQSALALEEIATPRLKRVVLAHLSKDCNEPSRVVKAFEGLLERHPQVDIHIASQETISPLWRITPKREVTL